MKGLTIFPLDARDRGDTAPRERYSSGLKGLDDINQGGWLRDSIVLVRGPSGSGKTTMAGMYARAGAMRGERVTYYGFEEPKAILMRNFASLGMPMDELEKAGHLRVFCRYPESTSPEDLLVDLRVGLDEYQPSLVVLDSISSIEHSTSANGFRHFMIGLASVLREHGRSALLTQTIAAQAGTDHAAPFLSTIADAILLLDYQVDSPELQRSIRVLKMRGSSHVSEKRRLAILPGGLRVEAIPKA
jgi:circadian clock protein KaiC